MSEPSMDLVCVACGRDYGAHIGDYCHPLAARSVPPSMFTPPPDPRDAEIAALRAEVEKLTRELSEPVARLQRALSDDDGFKVACEALVVEKRLREKAEARVAALEAVALAARSEIAYMDETKAAHPDALVEPTLNELRAALAAVEVPRG